MCVSVCVCVCVRALAWDPGDMTQAPATLTPEQVLISASSPGFLEIKQPPKESGATGVQDSQIEAWPRSPSRSAYLISLVGTVGSSGDAMKTLFPVNGWYVMAPYLDRGFGLAAAVVRTRVVVVGAGVVVVGAGVGVLVNPVQQPQEELQGVVLRVPPELGVVLGDDTLEERQERRRSDTDQDEPVRELSCHAAS